MHLHWRQKVTSGSGSRAETFFNFTTTWKPSTAHFFDMAGPRYISPRVEGFLALLNTASRTVCISFDEPEAALSPQRQLALPCIPKQLSGNSGAQFVIATHSPALLTFPGATLVCLEGGGILPVR